MTVALGLLEVLDRDGQVRHTTLVRSWPLRIGRALDNDLVLSDSHVAPHHASLVAAEHGLELAVGETRNGVQLGARHLRSGERLAVPLQGHGVDIGCGRTRLRLRLPEHALAPEVPLVTLATHGRHLPTIVVAGTALLAGLLFNTWLQTDPDTLGRAIGSTLLTAISACAVWCGAWALLSKTFTRQAHFSWHLRVFLFAAVALLLVDVVPELLAFSLSWPALADFSFIATFAVAATGLYHHLIAVEPARHRLLRGVVTSGALAGVALTLWFNAQRTDRLGDELYMHHLFPPALRLARPIAAEAFIDGLERLKPVLDDKAGEPAGGEDSDDEGGSNDE